LSLYEYDWLLYYDLIYFEEIYPNFPSYSIFTQLLFVLATTFSVSFIDSFPNTKEFVEAVSFTFKDEAVTRYLSFAELVW